MRLARIRIAWVVSTAALALTPIYSSLAADSAIDSPAKSVTTSSTVLWDAWYTVTVGDSSRYGYYNDRVEKKDGKIIFKNQFWKNEEGFINEESLGTFSDEATLAPLFFNFRSVYRTTETRIDGTVNGNELSVKILKGGQEQPIVRRSLPPKTIFSAVFPVWLGRKLSELKSGTPMSFMTILEDGVEQQFNTVSGLARLEKPDAFSKKSGTRKVHVRYRDLPSEWYFDDKGVPVRIEMTTQKTRIDRVPREEAEKFLRNNPPSDSAATQPEQQDPTRAIAATPDSDQDPRRFHHLAKDR